MHFLSVFCNAFVLANCVQAYVSLPAGVSMAEGHCLICPLQHHCSATGLDEDVWSEMQVSQSALHVISVQAKMTVSLTAAVSDIIRTECCFQSFQSRMIKI